MESNKLKRMVRLGLALVSLGLAAFFVWKYLGSSQSPEIYLKEVSDEVKNTIQKVERAEVKREGELESENKGVPPSLILDVPFTSQAPFANWDERHEEACEEASLIMVAYFLQGKKINQEIAEEEIQKMIEFQLKNYGDYKDSNAAQMIQLAQEYFGVENLKAIYDFQKEDLKKELAKGNPVIVPAAGRELKNPNFKNPGPLYHALVLIGYDEDEIIANDPGTRKGAGYRYNLDVLYSSIHDFPGNPEEILKGGKAMIVIDSNN